MGSGQNKPMMPNLFSTELPRDQAASPTNPPTPTVNSAASSPRHVLPSDLPAAIKHLNDQELEQLLAAVTAKVPAMSPHAHRNFARIMMDTNLA